MRLSDFDFHLPADLIAQQPVEPRDSSRLLGVDRASGTLHHATFADLPDRLSPGDLVVLNDTRVRPARLLGVRPTGGRVEVLLLRERPDLGPEAWEALVRPGRKLPVGARIAFGDGLLQAEVRAVLPDGHRVVVLSAPPAEGESPGVAARIARVGALPLPPYITAAQADPERYQTVYARVPGAVAAPTAGLHFTPELFARLEARGIGTAQLTLHTGVGTFKPVTAEDVVSHPMHAEAFTLPAGTAEAIAATKARGGRVVAVGTTVTRALEHCAGPDGVPVPQEGETALFIYPGYRYRVVDGLITNFHLPKSSLVMLVAAFLDQAAPGQGVARLQAAYAEAISRRYRFYSFGDAMLVL